MNLSSEQMATSKTLLYWMQTSRDVPYTSYKSYEGSYLSRQSEGIAYKMIPFSTGSLVIISLLGCLWKSQHCFTACTVPLALPIPKIMSTDSVSGPPVYIILVKHLESWDGRAATVCKTSTELQTWIQKDNLNLKRRRKKRTCSWRRGTSTKIKCVSPYSLGWWMDEEKLRSSKGKRFFSSITFIKIHNTLHEDVLSQNMSYNYCGTKTLQLWQSLQRN